MVEHVAWHVQWLAVLVHLPEVVAFLIDDVGGPLGDVDLLALDHLIAVTDRISALDGSNDVNPVSMATKFSP